VRTGTRLGAGHPRGKQDALGEPEAGAQQEGGGGGGHRRSAQACRRQKRLWLGVGQEAGGPPAERGRQGRVRLGILMEFHEREECIL